MMELKFTNEELEALKKFKDEKCKAINQLLISNCETDIALLSDDADKKVDLLYTKEAVMENIKCIKLVYKLILKQFYKTRRPQKDIYRGTNIAEVERIKNEPYIDKFLTATLNQEKAEKEFAVNYTRPAVLKIKLGEDVPHIYVKDVLGDNSDEVIIAPFTRLKSILLSEEKEIDNKATMVYSLDIEKQNLEELSERERNGLYSYILDNCYSINRKLLECITLEEDNATNYDNIHKLEQLLSSHEAIMEEKEATGNYPDKERDEDIDNLERIARQLDELKVLSTDMFEVRKEHINFVNMWKRNVAVYMLAECREIEKQFEDMELPKISDDIVLEVKEEKVEVSSEEKVDEEASAVEEVVEDPQEVHEVAESEENVQEEQENNEEKDQDENLDKTAVVETIKSVEENEEKEEVTSDKSEVEKVINEIVEKVSKEESATQDTIKVDLKSSLKENLDERKTKIVEKFNEVKEDVKEKLNKVVETVKSELIPEDELYVRVKQEAKENVEATEKLLEDIKVLITKQQNHAKIAGNIGSQYSALNNAFEMRKVAETLNKLTKEIEEKINDKCEKKKTKAIEEELENISKKNIEISTLMNYLNNPKIAVKNAKITRFEEMAIIEENELKRGIAEKIRDIRGEAEIKKLKDDLEIIEDKGTFSRFIGIFTGQNKLDEFMIEQIEVRQRAIRRTIARKLSLARNYSIHELIAEIEMFIRDNEDDELVEDDVLDLSELKEELKRNYVVIDYKVEGIIEKREGKNLPLDKKISKREIIEIETYRFLNKYGYDDSTNGFVEEPKYQDTMANEIARIVEYINSADIL